MSVRLQKFLAEAGIASRRASEQLIVQGHVHVNGRPVSALGTKIDPASDKITIDGKPVKPKRKLYLAIHKPPGYICSRNDPENRRSVGELLPKEWNNLYSVGRLDYWSEGLIFYTNDGDFSLKLTHPRFGVKKIYRVALKGNVDQQRLAPLTRGIMDQGEMLKAERVRILKGNNSRSMVEVTLRQGKNRELRRMFEVLGIEVEQLQRTQIGSVKLAELPRGKWRTLTESEIKSLLSLKV